MRHLIKKILKEDIFQMDRLRQLEEGDLFVITNVNQNLKECDPDAVNVLNPLIGKVCKVIMTDWDVSLMDGACDDHYGWGAYIMSEHMVGGHNLSAKGDECKRDKCYWVNDYYIDYEILNDIDTDEIFSQLDEQEEDDFGWAEELVNNQIELSPSKHYPRRGDIVYITSKDANWMDAYSECFDDPQNIQGEVLDIFDSSIEVLFSCPAGDYEASFYVPFEEGTGSFSDMNRYGIKIYLVNTPKK